MRSDVVYLQPRPAPFESAVAAYRSGRPAQCIELLRGRDELPARVLRARAALRTSEIALGVATLSSAANLTFPTYRDQGEFLMMRGVLQSRSRDADGAAGSFELARSYAYGSPSGGLEAEFHFYDAARHFEAGRADESVAIANRTLEIAASPLGRPDDYFVDLGLSRARAMQLLGVVAATNGRYREHLEYIRTAIDEVETVVVGDRWITAQLLMNLAFYVRDFDLVDDAAFLRAQFVHEWPADMALMAFNIVRCLGWSSALRGDHVGAFRDFRWCAEHAPTPALVVTASADRAFLGSELGEANFARDQLDRASEIAASIDWNAIATDDRFALLLLARQMAAVDAARARTLFETYRRISTKLLPHLINSNDRRLRAQEQMIDGLILRNAEANEVARGRFLDSFDTWNALGYRWLAATAAIELAELDGGEMFFTYARAEAESRPNSWLARRVVALEAVRVRSRLERSER